MKRVLAVFLAVLLCIQVLPLTLFAEAVNAPAGTSEPAAPMQTEQTPVKAQAEQAPAAARSIPLRDPDGGDEPEGPMMCTPVLRVWTEPSWGSNVTNKCTVVWRLDGEVLEEPISVEAGTTLSYEVTPTDALTDRDGNLYYRGVSGEVTLTEPEQQVDVYLIRLGRIRLTLNNQDGAEVRSDEGAGYAVTWYSLDGEDYVRIGEGLDSPVAEVGTTLYCDVAFSGVNAQLYPNAEKYPCEVSGYASNYKTITFTSEDSASATVMVTGFDGVDVTAKCTIEIKDRNGNVLQAPYTLPAGSWIRYTVTPKNVLKINGVQYYKVTTGEVQLLSEDQAVNVALGMQGTVTVKLVDKKTGEEIPMDGDDGWSVQWYHNGSRDGSGDTSRMHDAGDEISCYLSLRGKTSTNYYNPGNVNYTVGFGNRTEIIDANIRVPELAFYTVERRVSQSGYLDVNRTDNGYTFESVFLNGEELVLDRDYVDTGYRVAFKPEYLASLGCGTHVFTVHYKETTAEDNYDTQLTVTLTKGDLNEVVFQSRANTNSFPNFYYNGEPKTLNPLLYVGSWANDQRMGMLREGVDYEIAYENNINATTDDNLAKAIFTGIGDYEGSTMVKEFKIKPCEINTGYADFEVVPNWDWPYLYDGTPKDMTDVSVYSRGKLLQEGVDYEISYDTWNDMPETVSSRIGSPTETVEVPIVIQGIGNYTSYWNSQSDYGTKVQYRIMPHVEESVGGTLVLNLGTDNEIPWTWQLDPDGLLTVSGEGEMPEFSAQYWLGGNDPDHYYFYGWRHGYSDYIKRAVVIGNVTRIESNAFDGCTNLVEAILPETVEVIGGSAFGNCRSLKTVHAPDSIRLPESLHTVESAMYYGCFGINTYNVELHLPDNITSYGLNSVPSSNKLYCRYGTTTHETLKAMGASGKHIVEGWDNYLLEYQDNYNLGGTYTVYGYVGHGGEERLPDFIDSITHYDIFGQQATLITKLTIPGNIRVLNGDAFRFLDNCTEVVIEPGAMESLIQGLLNGHPETLLTIPDTVTTMPNGDFSRAYYGTTVIVGEGSAALKWAIAQGYYPDDGSGYGKLYRVVKNVQPYVTPLTASVPSDTQEDVTITRNDGAFTFDSLLLNDTALTPDTDYSVDGTTVTLKAAFLQTLEVGTHEIVLHYTGLADGVAPIDPVFKITVVSRCRPVLTVLDKDGQDVTALCDVVWKSGSKVLEEPFSVAEGAAITYTVTPKDDLMQGGVQYYKAVSGEVRLTEAEQAVEVTLDQLGTYTVTPTFNEQPITEDRTVRWFVKAGSGYYQLGTGDTSPLVDVGKTLYYDVLLSGENALDYVNLLKIQTDPVVFGNTAIDAALSASPTMYRVNFHLNGGTESVAGSCGAQSIQRNHELILPVAPVRRGYVFTGWSCNYDGSIRQPGESVVMKQDVYFYAEWVEMTPLTVAFDLDPAAGRVSLVGVTDDGKEISMWGATCDGTTPLAPIPLGNGYRNDNTIASVVLKGKVDGVEAELARYDDPNGDLYDTEGTVTLTKVGDWTPVTAVQVDGMTPGVDYYSTNYVYSDPNLARGTSLYLPILTDGSVPYYVRFSGHPGSENYVNHDWTKVYALTLTDGVLHAAVDAIAPETWTGSVVFGSGEVPVPNATVTLSQYAYGLSRGYSAVTDDTGSFTIEGFPDVTAHLTVNWGGRRVYNVTYDAMQQALVLPLDTVLVFWQFGFDGIYDEAIGQRIVNAVGQESFLDFYEAGENTRNGNWVGLTSAISRWLYGFTDLNAITWTLSGKYIEPLEGSLEFTDGIAQFEAVQTLRAAVLVSLGTELTTHTYRLAWFDENGQFLAEGSYFYLSNHAKDCYLICPEEDGGSYILALLPEYWSRGLSSEDTLSNLPETWILNTWAVTLQKNEVKELSPFTVSEVATENTSCATKPYSTLNAGQESFSSQDELIRFTGTIGLDANMKNGRLTKLTFATGSDWDDNGYDAAGTLTTEYLVINGQVYSDFSYGHSNRTIYFNTPIELPCDFTLYGKPLVTNRNLRLTVSASGSYSYGAGHTNGFSDQIGSVTVYRPGSVISTTSSYLCTDTVTVRGTALKNESVTIYDGTVLIGTAVADRYGDWEATVQLYGTDGYLTTHALTAETESGSVSDKLWLYHDPNGPELKSFRMIYRTGAYNTGIWYEIEPGGSYGAGWLYDLTFKARFEQPESLQSMGKDEAGQDVKVSFKVYMMNGEVRYLDAVYDAEEDAFVGTFPGRTNSAVVAAEVLYNPIVYTPEIGEDLSYTDAYHAPVTLELSEAELADYNNYATAVLSDTGLETDSYDIDFTGETAAVSGELPEGKTLADFSAAADDMTELDLHLGGVGVSYTGTPQSILQWLGQAEGTWLTARPEEAGVGVFTRVLTLPDRESFEREVTAFTPYALSSSGGSLAYEGGEAALNVLSLTDATVRDGELYGSYFITVQTVADDGKGLFTLTVNLYLTDEFTGFSEALQAGVQAADAPQRALSTRGDAGTRNLEIRQLPDWYVWLWEATDKLSGDTSAALGFINGGCDMAKAFPRFSKFAGQASGAFALLNQFTSTINYIVSSDDTAKKQGERINNFINSSCYKKAMQWLYEQGMNNENFDDGGLYRDQCNLINAMRDADFSGDITGYEKAAFYVNSACNAVAIYAALGGPVSWAAGLGVTGFGYLFGKVTSKWAEEEQNARTFLYRRFMANCIEMFAMYSKANPDDPDCNKFNKAEDNQEPAAFKPVFDPSGVVFEGVIENPIEGATATLYYAVDHDGNLVQEDLASTAYQLLPADEVRSLIPTSATQTTDANGRYAWYVPEGLWYVAVSCDGYESGSSNDDTAATVYAAGKNLLPVLPVQLNVNIPLVDRAAPYVTDALYTTDGVYITFSKYMDEDTVLKASNYSVFLRHGGDGDPDEWDYTVEPVEQGHVPDNLPDAGKTYTRTVLLRIDELQEGDVVHWTVNGNVRSYAGTRLGETYKASGLVGTAAKLDAPAFYVDGAVVTNETSYVASGLALELRLPASASEIASAKIVYSTDGGETWKAYTDTLPLTNNVDVLAKVEAYGYTESETVSRSFVLTSTLAHCFAGTVTTSTGVSADGVSLTLTGPDGYSKTISVVQDGFAFFDLPNGSYTLAFAGSDHYAAASMTVEIQDNSVIQSLRLTAAPCDWALTEWVWSTNTQVEAIFTCGLDEAHVETVPATVSAEHFAVTCLEPETLVFTATVTFGGKTCTDVKTVLLNEPTGHDWAAPTYTWAADNSTVTAARICNNDPSHTETETVDTTVETVAATCTAQGNRRYTATFENPVFETQTKTVVIDVLDHTPGEPVKENEIAPTCLAVGGYDTVVYCTVCKAEISRAHTEIPALGHDWNAPTYEWAADNSTVTAARVCKHDASHVETETVNTVVRTTEATCTEAGERFYTATFENPAFETQTKTVTIDPKGHAAGDPVKENEVAPTCTVAGGFDSAVYCAACGEELSREHVDVAALGHDYQAEVTAPTCTEKGYTTYTCSRCGDSYMGDEIAALGHDWNAPTYVWSDDNSGVTATRSCKRDASHVETETATATSEVTKEATYDAEGEITYKASFTNPAFAAQEKKVATPILVKPVLNNPFTDVSESAYYYDAVLWAVNHDPQITNGTSATTFSPDAPCTRGQVVTFLWRASGCPTPKSTSNPFRDVKTTDYYYTAVLWAAENGITTGTSATTFSPNDPCTRAHVVTFLWRAQKEPTPASANNPFNDVASGQYYTTAVLWAVGHTPQITNGTSATTFSPNATCTRGQIVTFLYRALAE